MVVGKVATIQACQQGGVLAFSMSASDSPDEIVIFMIVHDRYVIRALL